MNQCVSEEPSREDVRKMWSLWKLPKRLRLNLLRSFVILLCVFGVAYYLTAEQDYQIVQDFTWRPYNNSAEIPEQYLVWNSKCHMLSMDPDDPSIRQFVKKETFEACSTKPRLTSIVRHSNGSIYLKVNQDAAKDYKDLSCCWAAIDRPKPSDHDEDVDNKISVGTCQEFEDQHLLSESIQVLLVICRDGRAGEVFKNIHAVVNPARVRHRLKNSDSRRTFNAANKSTRVERQRALSVLVLGLDSVSRLNFYRTMPATRTYFAEREWFELRAYNKMGDNTFPNLMAVLSGQNETMSNSKCNNQLPYSLDHCPMIWYNFRDSGYATAYAEDTADINTFNNAKVGFVDPPTDYYFRPYVLASEKLLKTRQRFKWTYCTGPELSGDRVFDAAVDMSKAFMGEPYFGFFWTNSLSHEYLNGPSVYDTRFLDKLQDMENSGVMEDTMIVVLSDHGMRFGDSRDSFVGWYEERLPFVYIWLPRWFRERNSDIRGALLANRDRLTSPYDMYETLRDILQRAGGQAPASTGCPTCSSLFKPLPVDRGCKDAGISPHWCTCAGFEPYNIADPIVLEGAYKFVEYVNNITQDYTTNLGIRLCSELKLKRIARVKKLIEFDNDDPKLFKLFYSLELMPGGGKFETTVTYHGLGKYTIREEEVSRINLYGHDAICLEKGYKKYCQCRLNVAYFILKWF